MEKTLNMGAKEMYHRDDSEQLTMEEIFSRLAADCAKTTDGYVWREHIEDIYARNPSEETGRPAISSQITFGAIFIKEFCHFTDEGTVQELQENNYMYMQYFLSLREFQTEPLFDPSMMVYFRKRFPVDEVAKINEYVCTGKWPEEQRNVDRNDDPEDRDEPPCAGKETGSKASTHKGKANPNASKRRKCAGRRTSTS